MEQRPLGTTDARLSVLGFGAAPLGGHYGDVDEAEATRAVQVALDAGITFFDVAPYYGETLAETRLGKALEGHRQRAFLSTKCCRYGLDAFDFSAGRIARSIDESLERLRTDYVDLFIVHDVEFGDRRQVVEEAIPAVRRVQEQGKARFVAISGLPIRYLRGIADEAPLDALLSYCHYNLLCRDLEEHLLPLVDAGTGLLNASPLHMGILSPGEAPEWHPAPEEVKAMAPKLRALCANHGKDLMQVALRFAVDHPKITSTLVGMKTPAEVTHNLAALETELPPELLTAIDAEVAPVRDRSWVQGRPENNP